jgi:hypothetical protein
MLISPGGGISGLVVSNRLTEDPNGMFSESGRMEQCVTSQSDGPSTRGWQPASLLPIPVFTQANRLISDNYEDYILYPI